MKRSYLKRTKLRPTSPKGKLIKKIDDYIRGEMIKERGGLCEICCGPGIGLGLFHIMEKGKYPRIRFHKENLLLVGWFCCHYDWHHNFRVARDRIQPRIIQLRGPDYEDRLKVLNVGAPKITATYLRLLYEAYKKEAHE